MQIAEALAASPAPPGGWPAWVETARHDDQQYPGAPDARPIEQGANCQRFALAVLELFGVQLPVWMSSDVWEHPHLPHVGWEERRDLDLALFCPDGDPCGAHMGVVLGDAVLHPCAEVGVPALWTLDEFAGRPRYACLMGPVRTRGRA